MNVSLKAVLPTIRRSSTCTSAKSSKSTKTKTCKRKPVRRALIVGIMYRNKEGETLLFPHRDAQAWRDILVEKYGYKKDDIVMMLDDEHTLQDRELAHLVPTRENLLRQIRSLVADARSGDRFMFYYAGHGQQIESMSKNEDDGFDEAIVPYSPSGEAEPILDDDLRDLLVEPLPIGAALTAIFDSCCSGTLLDLEHYACNNVYFPWVNRGKRDLRSPNRARLRRKNDDTHVDAPVPPSGCLRICERTRSKSDAIIKHDQLIQDTGANKQDGRRFVVRSSTLEVPRRARDSSLFFENGRKPPRRVFSLPHTFSFKRFFGKPPQCAEPESYLPCDGFSCAPEQTRTKPHVISISACQDPEKTWDCRKGLTLTQAMITLLKKCPNMPIRRLIEQAGHGMHSQTTLKLHRWSQKKLKAWRAHHSPREELGAQFEIFDSPMPQIGSTNVLTAHEPFRA
uniref:Metacaspase-1 (EC) n=1 Tax=Ganoderma boninense TaxID=34458 RepID=A0A5K1JSP7_9APHY|nr:Metacaspase-1 (EC [Ganoderma boninense]